MLDKARSWGIPAPELEGITHLQLMRWDEKQNGWQRFRSFHLPFKWLGEFIVLDMLPAFPSAVTRFYFTQVNFTD